MNHFESARDETREEARLDLTLWFSSEIDLFGVTAMNRAAVGCYCRRYSCIYNKLIYPEQVIISLVLNDKHHVCLLRTRRAGEARAFLRIPIDFLQFHFFEVT